ncbi:unnamed protein product [Oikopleura dioica]|uniref:Rab-GAP TBC domain-containing protein n=2 Tax=Oikopleura dioica TaxID=34765 RepID=E4YU91_OIKDI|nr:unnamed protein product [Oikopleura dioica]
MYGSKSSLSSFQSSKFGDDSDDEDISEINRHGFKVKNGVIEDGLNVSIEKNREREGKWLLMLANWNLYSKSKKYQSKLKNRVRKGIPDAIRGKAWMFLRASAEGKLDDKGTTFKKLDEMSCSAEEDEQIEKDLHRQFPDHEMFSTKGSGKQDLYRVLKSWAVYRPEVGYCQGQAPIASLLLMHLTAEDAFWSLVAICDYFIPGYYDIGLTAIQMDGLILESLTGSYCSDVHKLLKATKVESMYYMTDWFMCIFIRTLPWNTVLRVFDLFLSEGVKVLFRVGLTMLRENLYSLSKKLKKNNADDLFMDAMTFAKRSPEVAKDEDYFIRQVCSCRVTERELTNEFQKQKKKWDKSKGDVRRNYFKRDPEGIYSDVKMPYTDGKMSKTINPISADAANVTTASRLTTVHESQEAQEEDANSQADERWKGVDSRNYDPNATIRPMPPLKTSAQSIAKPPRSTSAPNKFPDTETQL